MSEDPEPLDFQPLRDDTDLFYAYIALLDDVLVMPEIRSALEDQNLTPSVIRNACVAGAGRVLQEPSREYATYKLELDRYNQAIAKSRDIAERNVTERAAGRSANALAVLGGVATAFGLIAGHKWPAIRFVWTVGLAALVIAAVAHLVIVGRRTGVGIRLLSGGAISPGAADLYLARQKLISAVSGSSILSFVRALVNEARRDVLGHSFSVTNSPGLSEVHDSSYRVSTRNAAELDNLLESLTGGSIGVAGSRGSGKSMLIRSYCEESHGATRDLRCMVAAPVDYDARDFVLHLLATFCRAVIARIHDRLPQYQSRAEQLQSRLVLFLRIMTIVVQIALWPTVGLVLLHLRREAADLAGTSQTVFGYLALAAFVLGAQTVISRLVAMCRSTRTGRKAKLRKLETAAKRDLVRVRYLQTLASGWSAALKLPAGMEARRSGGISKAEQPLSYPEIVDSFRALARDTAEYMYQHGERVFIGLDELDKIGSPEQAQRFLNEIKGIFGVPHVYFLVSVSDDALTAFERRGLPLRDVFDSSFDEMVRAEPLSYLESRRLLYRRVIGLTEPYIALCHCLSGGLARDLIRAARQVVRLGEDDSAGAPRRLEQICPMVVYGEVQRKAQATARAITSLGESGQAQHLLETLQMIAHQPKAAILTSELIWNVAQVAPGEPARTAALRLDVAGYLYFCKTLEEVFSHRLTDERVLRATDHTGHPGDFDTLAMARFSFAENTFIAWKLISDFRIAWGLPSHNLPGRRSGPASPPDTDDQAHLST